MKAIIHPIFRAMMMNRSLIAYILFAIGVSIWGIYNPLTKTSLFSDAYDTSWTALGPGEHPSKNRLYRRGFYPRSFHLNNFHK